MKLIVIWLILLFWQGSLSAQSPSIVNGLVVDSRSGQPLAFATIVVKGTARGTVAGEDGRFRLAVPAGSHADTLVITHLGYAPYEILLSGFAPEQTVPLEESYTLLDVVTISRTAVNTRDIEKGLRVVRGHLYAMETEVTISQYNLFLSWLEEAGQRDRYAQCDYDLSGYDQSARVFFRQYVSQYKTRQSKRDSVKTPHIGPREWGDYPVVNIRHAAAREYCRWLTEQYNTYAGRKKFRRVVFRLPTLQEWQIAALGYDKFQSWTLADNEVPVVISKDSLNMMPKSGVRKLILVADDVLYPWYGSYYYRRSPQNHRNCFLGNFKVEYVEHPCPANNPAYDGWSMMGRTASYFPNNIGLYDVVGNVAEMIDEAGKACGGSWNDPPQESTIHSVKRYQRADATIGFRIFMEVVDE